MSGEVLRACLAAGLYRPPFAIVAVAVLVVLVVLAGVMAARREGVWWPVVLRLIAVGVLGWVLFGYSEVLPGTDRDAKPPTLAVLVDTSTSMAEQDAVPVAGGAAISRLQAVADAHLGEQPLAVLRGVANVRLVAFDEQVRPAIATSLQAEGQGTELFRALSQTAADATLILSDGHDTSQRLIAPPIADAGRLFAVPVGAPRSSPDLALQAWPDSDRLFEDQSTTITASIRHTGFAGRRARVELLHEGAVVDTRPVTLDRRSTAVRFEVAPPLATGRTAQANHYTVHVRLAQGDEAYPDNNAQDVFIQTSRGQVRVLLLEGEPYWDTRSLARLVTSHPRFDLTAIYGFGDERRARRLGASWGRAGADPVSQLDAFDIVVLGRQVQRLVDTGFAERLTGYVRGGGAVVFARGQPFEIGGDDDLTSRALLAGIETISPVRWAEPVLGEMRVRLGETVDTRGPLAGLQEGEVLTRLPGMLAATRIDGRKAASLVMLQQQAINGPSMAALTSLRVGSGISMAVLTEGLWRWELLPGIETDDSQAESVYGVFWVRALQWLASGGDFLPGQDIALEADRLTTEPDQTIGLRISTRYVEAGSLALQLTATHNDGSSQTLTPTASDTPGSYVAAFTPKRPGVYTFRLSTPQRSDLIGSGQPLVTRIAVIDRSAERRDTSAKPDALKRLVEPTGGRCLALGEIEPVIGYLQTLQALRGGADRVDYAFSTWPVFALIAGCFGVEWILRRRMGLR